MIKGNKNKITDLMCHVKVVLGENDFKLSKVGSLVPGTLFELKELAGEPATLEVNSVAIAKGEVVVIDEKYGLRITEVIKKEERGF